MGINRGPLRTRSPAFASITSGERLRGETLETMGIEELMSTEETKPITWASWWFVNGGQIHQAWKHRQWTLLKEIAQTKPKQAWDIQQAKIDSLEKERDELKISELCKGILIISRENDINNLNEKYLSLVNKYDDVTTKYLDSSLELTAIKEKLWELTLSYQSLQGGFDLESLELVLRKEKAVSARAVEQRNEWIKVMTPHYKPTIDELDGLLAKVREECE